MGLACADPTASKALAPKTLEPIKHLSIIARIGSLPVAALKCNLLLVAGKCMMDRNVPEALRDTAQSGYDQSKALIGNNLGRSACACKRPG
jgi:hypothetical protein